MQSTMKNLAGARSAGDLISRANGEASERGHGQRTAFAGAGGLLGAILGSFFGRSGAGFGGLLGALIGAFVGQRKDQGLPALPQGRRQLPAQRLRTAPVGPVAASRATRGVDEYIDATFRG